MTNAPNVTAPDQVPARKKDVLDATRRWLERSVLDLNLCPFAAVPYRDGRVRIRITDAETLLALVEALNEELVRLSESDPVEIETTLLVHPGVLEDFEEYNDFLDTADELIAALGLEGELQVASFHPDYRFADADPDDPANCTNRSPYPMLHLLREASVERAVDSVASTDSIVERNERTLRALGLAAWRERIRSR